MSAASQYYASLFNRLLEGELSPEDSAVLIAWLGSKEMDTAAAELIIAQLQRTVDQEQLSPELLAAFESKLPAILANPLTEQAHVVPLFRKKWFRYAAAFLILLGLGTSYLLLNKTPRKPAAISQPVSKIDIPPGQEGAILTLTDGSTVVLDSLGNGIVATQNGTQVTLSNGQLAYNSNNKASNAIAYNTVTTPKGRQFRLLLQDGTKVWLNAASSVRYPTVFTGKARKVEVTGEVYFEVAKNESKPFHVKVNNETEIEVLGTHFNVNSYTNEATVNTTLLEGMVKVSSGKEKAILKPGQQAQVADQPAQSQQPRIKVLSDVDMEKVMAWKNGVFNFQDANLKEVMRQLERWYDIEVVFEKGVPEQEFIGKMGRDLTLSEVLRGLEVSKVHFRIQEGRRVIVMP